MVVMGGIFLLDSDDDEEDHRRQGVARGETATLPAVAYLTPRPWMLMYNQRLPIPESSRDNKAKLGLIQKLLPEDVMLEIFTRMTPVAVSRVACCCRTWRLLSYHESIWEKASYGAWEHREEPEDTERIARDRFHGSWRRMFFNRVRLRTEGKAGLRPREEMGKRGRGHGTLPEPVLIDELYASSRFNPVACSRSPLLIHLFAAKTLAAGIYVSRNTYIKPGVTDWDNVNPVHLVCYYRYMRFFSNGEFLSKTSPHKLAQVHKTFKSRYLAAKDDTMYHGVAGGWVRISRRVASGRVEWAPFHFPWLFSQSYVCFFFFFTWSLTLTSKEEKVVPAVKGSLSPSPPPPPPPLLLHLCC